MSHTCYNNNNLHVYKDIWLFEMCTIDWHLFRGSGHYVLFCKSLGPNFTNI